jgi:hypothetical protein
VKVSFYLQHLRSAIISIRFVRNLTAPQTCLAGAEMGGESELWSCRDTKRHREDIYKTMKDSLQKIHVGGKCFRLRKKKNSYYSKTKHNR